MAEGDSGTGLMETLETGSTDAAEARNEHDASLSAYCQPCQDEGEQNDAEGFCQICKEHLCNVCIKIHKRTPALKRHKIVETIIRDVSSNSPSKQVDLTGIKRLTFEKCPIHEGQFYKFYCPHHDMFGCGDCTVMDHRNCKMQYIPEAAKDFKTSAAFAEKKAVIEETISILDTCVESISQKCTKLEQASEETICQISEYSSEVQNSIKQREEEVISTVKKQNEKNKQPLNDMKEKCLSLQMETKQVKEMLKSAEDDDISLFVFSCRATKRIQGIKENAKIVAERNNAWKNKPAEYKKNSITIDSVNKPEVLGWVWSNDTDTEPIIDHCTFGACKLELDRTVSVASSVDEHESCARILSIVPLSATHMFLVDYNNSSCKILDISTDQIISQLKMPFAPCDATVLSDSKVAVTYQTPYRVTTSIDIVSTDNGQIKALGTLKTSGYCSGISYAKGNLCVVLVASKDKPARIHIRADSGKRVVISEDGKGNKFLCHPKLLAFGRKQNQNVLYVADVLGLDSFNLVKLNTEGKILATYTNWDMCGNEANGFTVTDSGHIFICNKVKHVIHLLSQDLEEVKVVLTENDGIKDPQAVYFCDETKRLYVSSSEGHRKELKVFKMCE